VVRRVPRDVLYIVCVAIGMVFVFVYEVITFAIPVIHLLEHYDVDTIARWRGLNPSRCYGETFLRVCSLLLDSSMPDYPRSKSLAPAIAASTVHSALFSLQRRRTATKK